MRDAFGGVFMIRLLLVFIVIYVAFTAISLNYAKAFRIKNKVIDLIEQNQVLDLEEFFNTGDGKNLQSLDNILNNANYNKTCINGNGPIYDAEKITLVGYCHNGIVIKPDRIENNIQYYNIYTYADWNLGVFNIFLRIAGSNDEANVQGSWKITGQAKVVINN